MSNKFDIVRISSHGEFINSALYDETIVNPEPKKVKFIIHLRGKIGATVLTRCNTLDVSIIDGEKYCSSFIGRRDFYENMVINYNDNGITSAIVMGCSTPLIPDMSLSFDDDRFMSGFALYKDDGVPLYCKGNYVSLNKFEIDGIKQKEIKLSEVLKIIYNNLQEKTGRINIYISSCLYIEPGIINNIKNSFPDWYNCNRENIIEGYEKELKDTKRLINIEESKVETCKEHRKYLDRINNDRNTKFFIDVLGNVKVKEGFEDYVYKYLVTEEQSIEDLDELINLYIDRYDLEIEEEWSEGHDKKYKEVADKVSKGVIEQLKNKKIDIEAVERNKSKLHEYTEALYRFKKEHNDIIHAIKTCQGDYVDEHPSKRRKTGGKKKDLTYKLKCLEKCKCKRGRVKKENMKYDMKQLEKNNKCYDKCHKRCFKKTLKKRGGTGSIEPEPEPEEEDDVFINELPIEAENKIIRRIFRNGIINVDDCLTLKNYTDANKRSLLNPQIKDYINKCVINRYIHKLIDFLKRMETDATFISIEDIIELIRENYKDYPYLIKGEALTSPETLERQKRSGTLEWVSIRDFINESGQFLFSDNVKEILLNSIREEMTSDNLELDGLLFMESDMLYGVDDVCDHFPYAELIASIYTHYYNLDYYARDMQFNRLLNQMLIRIKRKLHRGGVDITTQYKVIVVLLKSFNLERSDRMFRGATLERRHSAPASVQYTDKLPSQGAFHHIIDNQDAYDEFIRQLATDNDRYSLKSCLELKNYTEANRRSMLDPIVKKHVKKCSKAIAINNFFNFIKEEYDKRPNIGLHIHVTYALERYRQRCIEREHITGDKTNMLLATNMEKVIMESDYYNFPLPIRKILLEIFKGIISNGVDRGYIHNKKDPGAIIYGVILFNFVAILINKGLNEFRIIFMDIIQNIQNTLREIDIDEDIIDEVVIKFIKSLYWNKIILV